MIRREYFVLFAIGLLWTSVANAAETRAQFCQRWHAVCTRCDGLGARVPRETCLSTCSARLANCRTTGCYAFNRPGPRCQTGPGGCPCRIDSERFFIALLLPRSVQACILSSTMFDPVTSPFTIV